MTISDAQYAAWLDDPTAQRVTLYRLGCISGGTQKTRYLSNRGDRPVAKREVAKRVATANVETERQLVDATAQVIADVRMAHRSDNSRWFSKRSETRPS